MTLSGLPSASASWTTVSSPSKTDVPTKRDTPTLETEASETALETKKPPKQKTTETLANLSPKTTDILNPQNENPYATLGSSIFAQLLGKQFPSAGLGSTNNTALQTFNQLPLPSISPIAPPVLPNATTSLAPPFMPQTVGQTTVGEATKTIKDNMARNLGTGKFLITDTVPLVPTNNATPAGVTLNNFNAGNLPNLA
jgi:hypothetical protein